MYKAYSKTGSLLLHGLLFLFLGIFMIVTRNYFIETFVFLGGVVFLLSGFLNLFYLWVKNNSKEEKRSLITKAIFNIMQGLLMLLMENAVAGLFPFFNWSE